MAETMTSALAVPRFRVFLAARSISWTGNAVTLVAMPVLVFQLTGSPALTGMLAAIEALPYLIFGLPAGALADRWNRQGVLVVTGVVSGLVLATIPAAATVGLLSVPQVFLVAITMSTLFVFFDAAGFGAVPELVGRDRIPSATGSMVSLSTVISLVGPAVGGALAAAMGPAVALAIDAIAYLVAAGITATISWPRSPPRDSPPHDSPLGGRVLVRDIAEGVRYIWQTPIVRWLTLIGAGASVSGGAILGLTVVIGIGQLSLADDDSRLGLLYSATALGALLISLVVSRIQRRVPTGWITIIALAVSWIAQLALATTTSLPVALTVLVVFQAAATLSIMNGIIVRQSLAPDRLQSRVNTTARMIAWGGAPVGALVGGALAEQLSTSVALAVCSVGTAGGLVVALSVKLWRVPILAELREDRAADGSR